MVHNCENIKFVLAYDYHHSFKELSFRKMVKTQIQILDFNSCNPL